MDINGKVEVVGERKIEYESKESVIKLELSIISEIANSNGAASSLILKVDIVDIDEDKLIPEDDFEGYKKTLLGSFLSKYDNYDMPHLTSDEVKKIASYAELWFYSNVSPIKSKLKIQELYHLKSNTNTRLIYQPRNNIAITTEVISKYEMNLS